MKRLGVVGRRHRSLRVLAAVLLAGAASACGSTDSSTDGRGPGGPLSVLVGEGGQSVDMPAGGGWATFGGFVLCARQPGEAITVERVHFDADPEPLEVRAVFRVAPPKAERSSPGSIGWSVIATQLGRPRLLDTGLRLRGSLTDTLRGPVTTPCQEIHAEGSDAAYTELLTVMKVDSRGAAIRNTRIDYRADGTEYALDIPWENVACGSAIPADGRICG